MMVTIMLVMMVMMMVMMMLTMMLMMVLMMMVMMTTPVQEHDTANEVEAEEHRQTKGDIHGHPLEIYQIIK